MDSLLEMIDEKLNAIRTLFEAGGIIYPQCISIPQLFLYVRYQTHLGFFIDFKRDNQTQVGGEFFGDDAGNIPNLNDLIVDRYSLIFIRPYIRDISLGLDFFRRTSCRSHYRYPTELFEHGTYHKKYQEHENDIG